VKLEQAPGRLFRAGAVLCAGAIGYAATGNAVGFGHAGIGSLVLAVGLGLIGVAAAIAGTAGRSARDLRTGLRTLAAGLALLVPLDLLSISGVALTGWPILLLAMLGFVLTFAGTSATVLGFIVGRNGAALAARNPVAREAIALDQPDATPTSED
jgi:hypothetical protein